VIAKLKEQPLLNGALVVVSIALIVFGVLAIGPASQSSGQGTRTTTVQRGVVQSTVSGSGNIQAAGQLNLGFKTGGTVTHIYVKQGQHVNEGQLLATLDPQSAEVTLEQAKASLQSADASLLKQEEGGGESSASSGSSTSATTAASASTVVYANNVAAPTRSTTTTTAPRTTTTTNTTSPTTTTSPPPSSPNKSSTSTGSTTTGSGSKGSPTSGSGQSTSSSGSTQPGTSTSGSTQSAATREANLASAKATVRSDKLTIESDEKAVQNTKLYAPEDGTIVSLSGEVGETVAGTGTTKASAASTSSASSTGAGAGAGSTSRGASTGAASSSTGSSGSSSSPFAVLSNLESLQLVVPLSESEISSVKVEQVATVAIEALSGRKLAGHVLSVNQLPTSSSGVVSYDVTFQLDQGAPGLKTGMSATAEVVVEQEEGLNVPTGAISGGSVTVMRGGKKTVQPVTTGLVGHSSTIILSGLKSGETVVLPTPKATSSGSQARSRTGAPAGALGGGFGGGALGGGGGIAGGGGAVGRGGGG
jgi:multidrug efflux pump subunit AcrA (membrane-fusion protein)